MSTQQKAPKVKSDNLNPEDLEDFQLPDPETLDRSVGLFKTLSNPHRIMILLLLHKGPQDVEHIHKALKISQPLASQHLKSLKHQGLVVEKREGKRVFYRLRSTSVSKALMTFIQLQAIELSAEAEAFASLNELLSMFAL